MTHRIGVIGGDGIGPEVVAEALKVIDATGVGYERTDYDLGAHRYLDDGTVLPDGRARGVAGPRCDPARSGR